MLPFDRATALLAEHWGLSGRLRDVGSTQDQNLRLDATDGSRYVMKIADSAVGRATLELQNAAMIHLRDLAVAVPAPVPTRTGAEVISTDRYFVRLLTWVDGIPLGERPYLGPTDVCALGRLAGDLAARLATFDHPALCDPVGGSAVWNATSTGRILAGLAPVLVDDTVQELVGRALSAYSAAELHGLVLHPVHADVSDLNTVCRPDRGTGSSPVGVLDFGDVMRTWRPADVAAVAVSVAGRADCSDALDAAMSALAGYHAAQPLDRAELAAYWPLVLARAGLALAISTRLSELNPGSTHLHEATELDLRAARTLFAASGAVAREAALGIGGHSTQPVRLVGVHPLIAGPLEPVLDQSSSSPDYAFGEWDEVDGRRLPGTLGRWGELRLPGAGRPTPHPRANLSLGSEIAVAAGASVHAPVAGVVHALSETELTILVGTDLWLRVGGVDCAVDLQVGTILVAGDLIGSTVAGTLLWVQMTSDPSVPRWGTASQREAWLRVCPDPSGLIGVDVAAPAPEAPSSVQHAHDVAVAAPQHLYFAAPPVMVRGWRQHLYDSSGRPYLDMVNNVATVGHSHPAVAEAATRQYRTLNTNSRFLYGAMGRFAERIVATMPVGLSSVFFVNSGSEAADLALQLAQVYTGRHDLIALLGAYHGWTGSVLDVCTNAPDRPNWRADLAPHVHPVIEPDPYRGPFGDDGRRYADDVARVCAEAAAAGRPVAAFISEALLGNAGGLAIASGYLRAAYTHVRAAGGLCIADEVQVGLGRTGSHWWAFESEGAVPDIVLSAKSVGNGHPVGFVACRPEVAAAFDAHNSFFASTGGSPVSCEIGLAVLDVIAREGLQQNASVVGEHLRLALLRLADRHDSIGAVHGRGLFLGVELVSDRTTKTPDRALAVAIGERMLELGVIVQPTGAGGNILKIKPPLCLDEQSADYFVAVLDRALADVAI